MNKNNSPNVVKKGSIITKPEYEYIGNDEKDFIKHVEKLGNKIDVKKMCKELREDVLDKENKSTDFAKTREKGIALIKEAKFSAIDIHDAIYVLWCDYFRSKGRFKELE